MVNSHLCKVSLQLVFITLSESTMITPSFLELAEEDCSKHVYVSNPCDVASRMPMNLTDSMLGRLAHLRTSLFDIQSYHLMLRMDHKQHW